MRAQLQVLSEHTTRRCGPTSYRSGDDLDLPLKARYLLPENEVSQAGSHTPVNASAGRWQLGTGTCLLLCSHMLSQRKCWVLTWGT